MRAVAYVFVALFTALFTFSGVKERLDASELARDGVKVVGKVESVQVTQSPVFPDFFYLHYSYLPPAGGSVAGRVHMSKATAKSVSIGMPVDVRVHRFYPDRHATIPYHLDMASDWLWPIGYGLLTLTLLYRAFVELRRGKTR